MASGDKISTDGGQGLGQNPFAALSGAGLPVAPKAMLEKAAAAVTAGKGLGAKPAALEKNRGRVTTVSGFVGIGLPEKEQLTKKMRGACGCGGTVKEGVIEIQGDQRETVARILTEAGFRAVMAGG